MVESTSIISKRDNDTIQFIHNDTLAGGFVVALDAPNTALTVNTATVPAIEAVNGSRRRAGGKPRKFNPETAEGRRLIAGFVRMYNQGKKDVEIAAALGIHQANISRNKVFLLEQVKLATG